MQPSIVRYPLTFFFFFLPSSMQCSDLLPSHVQTINKRFQLRKETRYIIRYTKIQTKPPPPYTRIYQCRSNHHPLVISARTGKPYPASLFRGSDPASHPAPPPPPPPPHGTTREEYRGIGRQQVVKRSVLGQANAAQAFATCRREASSCLGKTATRLVIKARRLFPRTATRPVDQNHKLLPPLLLVVCSPSSPFSRAVLLVYPLPSLPPPAGLFYLILSLFLSPFLSSFLSVSPCRWSAFPSACRGYLRLSRVNRCVDRDRVILESQLGIRY